MLLGIECASLVVQYISDELRLWLTLAFLTHSKYLFPSSDASRLNSHTYMTHCSLGAFCELNVRLAEPQSRLSPCDSSCTVSLSPPITSWRLALLRESELGEPACSGWCHVSK